MAPVIATFMIAPGAAITAGISLAGGIAVLIAARRAIAKTTLLGPWCWTVAALLSWALIELAAALSVVGRNNAEPIQFACVALSLCPGVAVIGAKRPQHVAWNFVVLSLWAIVAQPAVENVLLHPGQKISIGDARAWFLWLLVLLGPVNYLPTRFAVASVLLAAGQVIALSPYLALIQKPIVSEPSLIGLLLAASALVAAWITVGLSKVAPANSIDQLWLDFRDPFGLLWGLRVQERVNALAQRNDWDLELTWFGLCRRSTGERLDQIESTIEPVLRTSLQSLLRRFV